jgi:hypothetical protein
MALMVQTFATSPESNDIYLDPSGNLAVLSGQAAVMAACATASKTQLGECVLQTGIGLPNFQAVWVGVPNIPLWQSYLRNTLQNVQGVEQVTSIAVRQVGNTLAYTATIANQYGLAEMQSALA